MLKIGGDMKFSNSTFEECVESINAQIRKDFDGVRYINSSFNKEYTLKGFCSNKHILTELDSTATFDTFLEIVQKDLNIVCSQSIYGDAENS